MQKDIFYVYYSKEYSPQKRKEFENCILSHAFGQRPPKSEKKETGKPYLKGSDFFISVSHSKNVFTYAISSFPIGIDVQVVKSVKEAKLAERFFSEPYALYARQSTKNFFEVFSKYEAYSKLKDVPLRVLFTKDTPNDRNCFYYVLHNFLQKAVFVMASEREITDVSFTNIDEIK